MAVKKINIPVGFQFDDPSQMLGKLKKAVDGLNLDSSLGKQMTSAIQKVEKDIAQLEQRAARGVSSDSDVAALSRGLESVVKQLNSIQEKSRSLTFKDIKLTPDQQKAWETLKQNVASARQELSQFQRSKLTELFKTDPNFSKVLQEQLEMTEDTVKNANQVENALRRQLEVLKSQVEEKRKLVAEDAKQAGVGSAARAEFAGLVDQFSDSKNKNRFGNGQADQGRLAFADFFKKIGVAATEADKVVKGSLQNIQKYFTSISGSEEFDKKLETDQAALSALEQQMADTQKASKTLENAMSLASRSAASDKVEEATRNQKDYEQQVVNSARANNTLGESAEEMGKKVASAGRQAIQTVQEQFTAAQRGQNMYDSMVASIQRLVGFTAVFTQVNRGIREAVSQIKELDSAMNAIAVVTDFTTEELWGQIDAYMGMARQYGVTTTGVYQVSQLYYQQGHDTAAVMDLTTETLKMARIAALDYSEATDYMTTALNGFKIEAEDAQRVTDVYSKLASIAATNTEELAKSMSNTAAIAASAGMSFESTSAMLAMMIEQTREAPENLGTSLKTITARFQEMKENPTELIEVEGEEASLNKVDAALKSVGISLKDASGQFRNLDEVIFELSSIWDTLDRNTQRWIANTTSGSRQQSRFIALMSDSERLMELYNAAMDSEDAGLVQYAATLDSIDAKVNQLSTSFQEFYMQIINGTSIKGLLDFVQQFVDRLNEAGPAGAAAIVAALLSAFKTLGMAFADTFAKSFNEVQKFLQSRDSNFTNLGVNAGKAYGAGFVEAAQAQMQSVPGLQSETIGTSQNVANAGSVQRRRRAANVASQAPSAVDRRHTMLQGQQTGLEKAGNNIIGFAKKYAGGIQMITSALSVASTAIYSAMDKTNQARQFGTAITSGATAIGAIAGIIAQPLNIGSWMQLIGAVTQLCNISETAEERIKRLNDAVEQSNINRAVAKDSLQSLEDLKKQYDELKTTYNNNEEAYQEWIDLNTKLMNDYPQLNVTLNEHGDYVVDLASKYDILRNSAQQAYDAAKQEYEESVIRRANDSAYALQSAGIELNTHGLFERLDTQEAVGAYIDINDTFDISRFAATLRNNSSGRLAGYDEKNITYILTQIIENNANLEQFLSDASNGVKLAAKELQTMGFTTNNIRQLSSQYDYIKNSPAQELLQLERSNIEESTSNISDDILRALVRQNLQQELNFNSRNGFTSRQYDNFKRDNLNDRAITDKAEDIRKQLDEAGLTLEEASEFLTQKTSMSLQEYNKFFEGREDIEDILDPGLEAYLSIANATSNAAKKYEQYASDLQDVPEHISFESIPIAFQDQVLEFVEQLSNLDATRSFKGVDPEETKSEVFRSFLYSIETLFSDAVDLDVDEITDILNNADFTSASGWRDFVAALESAKVPQNLISIIASTGERFKTSLADAYTATSNLQTALELYDKVGSKFGTGATLRSLAGEIKEEQYSQLLSIGIDPEETLTAQDIFDKVVGAARQKLSDYEDELTAQGDYTPDASTEYVKAWADSLETTVNDEAATEAKKALNSVLSQVGEESVIVEEDVYKNLDERLQSGFEQIEQDGEIAYKLTTPQKEFLNTVDKVLNDANSIFGPQLGELFRANLNAYIEKIDASEVAATAKKTSAIKSLMDAAEDEQISITQEVYDVIKDTVQGNKFALNPLTGEYDFNGTVIEYFDAIASIIGELLGPEALAQAQAQLSTSKTNYINTTITNATKKREAAWNTALGTVSKVGNSIDDYATILTNLRDGTASAEEASAAVEELGVSLDDLGEKDGKYVLFSDLSKTYNNIADLENEIKNLQDATVRGTEQERKAALAVLKIRQQELETLRDKELLLGKSDDFATNQFSDVNTFLSNADSLADVLTDMQENARIPIETLYNLLENANWEGPLADSIAKVVGIGEDGARDLASFSKALLASGESFAIANGTAYMKVSSEMAQAIQTGSEDQLKSVAESRIAQIDAQLAALRSMQEWDNITIENSAEVNELIESTFTDATTGKSYEDFESWFDDLRARLQDSETWEAISIDVAAIPADVKVGSEEWQRTILAIVMNHLSPEQWKELDMPINIAPQLKYDPEKGDITDQANDFFEKEKEKLRKMYPNVEDEVIIGYLEAQLKQQEEVLRLKPQWDEKALQGLESDTNKLGQVLAKNPISLNVAFNPESIEAAKEEIQKNANALIILNETQAQNLQKAGWTDATAGKSYTVSHDFGNGTSIVITPILANGEILSVDSYNEYINGIIAAGADGLTTITPNVISIVSDEEAYAKGVEAGEQYTEGVATNKGQVEIGGNTSGLESAVDQAIADAESKTAQVQVAGTQTNTPAATTPTETDGEIKFNVGVNEESIAKLPEVVSTALSAMEPAKLPVEADLLEAGKEITDFANEVTAGVGTNAKIPVDADTNTAQSTVNNLLSWIRGRSASITIKAITDSARTAIQNIINLINSVPSKRTVTVETVNTVRNVPATGTSTNNAGNGLNFSQASGTKTAAIGTNNAIAGKTLVGELGPELRVSDGRFSVVGAEGAEFVNLKRGDIIFDAEKTAKLLRGYAGVRGIALAQGNISGPAAASGIEGAIAALEAERAMWQSILDNVPDLLKKAGSGKGGGGGGGSDEDIKEYLMELERWFNWLRQIEQLENRITILRAERENFKDGKVYADSLYEENALLMKQNDITQDLLDNQIAYRRSLRDSYLRDYGKYFYFVGDALQINAEAILEDTKNNEELGEAIQNMIDEYDDINEQITDNTVALEENKQQMEDNLRDLRDKYIDMENEILAALKNSYQTQIDLKQKALDERVKADEAYLDALEKNLKREQDMRDRMNDEQEYTQLQRRLALLERDTSGKNAKEIADLRQQLREAQENRYFDERENSLEAAREASEAQQELLQDEIDVLTETNQIKLENMELYWQEVAQIISEGTTGIMDFLTTFGDSFNQMSQVQQEDYIESWQFTVDAALEYAKDMSKVMDELIYKAQEAKEYGNTSATGGLDTARPSSSSSSSGGSASGSYGGSSGSSSSKSSSSSSRPAGALNIKDSDVKANYDNWDTGHVAPWYTYNGKPVVKRDGYWYYYSTAASGSSSGSSSSSSGSSGTGHWKYTITVNGVQQTSQGGFATRELAQAEAQRQLKKYPGGKYTTKYYKQGGLVDYTGLAMVHGSKTKPESFINAEDTKMLSNLMEFARQQKLYDINVPTISSGSNNTSTTIGDVYLTIESGVIADSADAQALGKDIASTLMQIARQSGNISVSRR